MFVQHRGVAVADSTNHRRANLQKEAMAFPHPTEDVADVDELPNRVIEARIVLLTPYTGGNLGDAAIQDSIIANLRLRIPGAQFAGLSLNSDNFVERHGTNAFPLCKSHGWSYRMYRGRVTDPAADSRGLARPSGEKGLSLASVKYALKRVPALGWCLKVIYRFARRVTGEIRHSVGGYRFLRTQDLLIVSGGGQLDDEWSGPW